MKFLNILILSIPVFLVGCASVSTLQTGRVLEKDKSFHSFGVGTYSSDDFLGGDKISLPLLEYTYRRGVWKNIDVGVKLAIIGSAMVDLKYNLLNGEKWALATGLGVGYLSYTSTVGVSNGSNGSVNQELESSIVDLMVPLYLSYDTSEAFTIYGAGKYMFRFINSDGASGEDASLLSSSLGVKWGQKSGVFLEGSLITGLDNDFSGTQFNGAYFFRF